MIGSLLELNASTVSCRKCKQLTALTSYADFESWYLISVDPFVMFPLLLHNIPFSLKQGDLVFFGFC